MTANDPKRTLVQRESPFGVTETNIDGIAQRWIRIFSAPPDEPPPDLANDDSFCVLPSEDPELCLAVILKVLKLVPADKPSQLLSVLAAGPMEDLLVAHGSALIERVETEAKSNPAFKLLLGGVWRNAMDEQVWARVQVVRGDDW